MKRHPRAVAVVLLVLTLILLGSHAAGGQRESSAGPADSSAIRLIVSRARRRLWAVSGSDTLLSAPVAVGSGRTLSSGGHSWTFVTPRGTRTVVSKEVDPVWVRPDWAYVEVARSHHLRLDWVSATHPRPLANGDWLVVQGRFVGVRSPRGDFEPLPVNDEIVFGNVLYVPPYETENRRMAGTLGHYRLNLGGGIGLHGTQDVKSIGRAVTHGCLRLGDDDLAWVYEHVPVGAKVTIY